MWDFVYGSICLCFNLDSVLNLDEVLGVTVFLGLAATDNTSVIYGPCSPGYTYYCSW